VPAVITDTCMIVLLAAVGACVGSFLNVVIHRLPTGRSIVNPPSHCPSCLHPIRAYDNVPVISYLLLRGRCRHCSAAISPRYVVVEVLTALLFVILYDAYFRSGVHGGFVSFRQDWLMFFAHLAALAGLLACSGMDIEHYLINITVPYSVMVVALVAWLGGNVVGRAYVTPKAGPVAFAASLAVAAIYGLQLLLYRLFSHRADESDEQVQEDQVHPENVQATPPKANVTGLIPAAMFTLAAVGLIFWVTLGDTNPTDFADRATAFIALAFLAVVMGCAPRRRIDQEIIEVIEEERAGARRQAASELLQWMPMVLAAAVVIFLLARWPDLKQSIQAGMDYTLLDRQPLAGLANWLAGLVAAAGFGWLVRISFTLLFGKEAMGVGDIYILAAVGCCLGASVSIVGFFLGAVVGLLGVLVMLLWKTSRALSFVPWISLGVLITVLFYDRIMHRLAAACDAVVQMIFMD